MDISYLLFLQRIREATGSIFDGIFLDSSALAGSLLTYMLMGFVYWCVNKRAGQMMALNVAVACTWSQFIKKICRIERPWVRDERVTPVESAIATAGGYSFPSGHTQRAVAVWGTLGAALWKDKKRALSEICWIIVLLIAFSRNYLGVHTPQDVLAAFILGIFLMWVICKVMLWTDGGKYRDFAAAAAGCLLCFLPMLKVGCCSNAGAGIGFMIGWALERHFVSFEVEGSWSCRLARFAVGGAGIAIILTVLNDTLVMMMGSSYAGFFTSLSLAFFIMAAYPFFFSQKGRYKAGSCISVIILAVFIVFAMGWQRHIQSGLETAETEADRIPVIIAHRGYSAEYPENTMAAFEGALDIGADYIELDVQMSKDGQVVVLHDDTLLRTTGAEGTPADYTYAELSELDAGSWFDASFAGEKIPTLREVLELVKNTECCVYLELKDIGGVYGFEEAVLAVVQDCGMTDRCLFASFNYDYLIHFKELNADLLTLYNTSSDSELLPEEYPADYYGLYLETATKEMVSAIHHAGRYAFVWTVNTPEQVKSVQAMNVDGIVTNYPEMAMEIILQEQE